MTQTYTFTHTCTHTHNSYLTVIMVHEMHGRMQHMYTHSQITILLAHDPLSSLAYPMMVTQALPSRSRQFAYRTLVAWQLPKIHTHIHTHISLLSPSLSVSVTVSLCVCVSLSVSLPPPPNQLSLCLLPPFLLDTSLYL